MLRISRSRRWSCVVGFHGRPSSETCAPGPLCKNRVSNTIAQRHLTWCTVPDEPLESSADMVEPDRTGTLVAVDSMVRVPVRGCVDMISMAVYAIDARASTRTRALAKFSFAERGRDLQASSLGSEEDYANMSKGSERVRRRAVSETSDTGSRRAG